MRGTNRTTGRIRTTAGRKRRWLALCEASTLAIGRHALSCIWPGSIFLVAAIAPTEAAVAPATLDARRMSVQASAMPTQERSEPPAQWQAPPAYAATPAYAQPVAIRRQTGEREDAAVIAAGEPAALADLHALPIAEPSGAAFLPGADFRAELPLALDLVAGARPLEPGLPEDILPLAPDFAIAPRPAHADADGDLGGGTHGGAGAQLAEPLSVSAPATEVPAVSAALEGAQAAQGHPVGMMSPPLLGQAEPDVARQVAALAVQAAARIADRRAEEGLREAAFGAASGAASGAAGSSPARLAGLAAAAAPPVAAQVSGASAPRLPSPAAAAAPVVPALVVDSRLPAMLNAQMAGWLEFRQTLGGLHIRIGSLLELLKDRFSASEWSRLASGPAADMHLSLNELRRAGIPLAYDPMRDVFELDAPAPAPAPLEATSSSAMPAPIVTAPSVTAPSVTAPIVTALTGAAQDLGAPSVLPREQELQLPVLVDGSYRGDIDIIIGADNQLRVRLDSVVTALGRLLRPEIVERLNGLPTQEGLVLASALRPDILLRLDETTIEVIAEIRPDVRPQGNVSLAEDRFANLQYIEPQPFAMAVAIDFGGAYSFREPTGFGGEAGRIASWVNIGGVDGVFLDAEGFYESDGERTFRRGDIRLSKDDPDNAIRYSIGDILYLTQGFQGAPRIGGIGAQRLYEELDPLRIIRPQGRTNFTLDRSATVEVIVNGIPFRTIRFDPGTYSINDIPYAEGGNNVELLIRDDSGIERRLEFSGYSSANLLEEGLSEFGIVAGFASEFTPGGISYDTDEPVASGFYRRGVASNLTLGANAQVGRNLGQVGGELIYAGPDLLVSARAAFSHLANRGSGYSWEVNTQYRPLGSGGVSGFFIEGNARGTSRDFASLGIIDPRNDFKLETAVRTGFAIDRDSNVSLGYTRQFARDQASDISRYSFTASRRFGNLAAFVTFDRREVQGQASDNRVLATISLPLGNRSTYARATYDSDRGALRAEVQRLPRGAVGDLSGSVAIETNDRGQELLGQVRYRHNRFIGGLDNIIVHDDAQSTIATAVTRYSLRTGFGLTGGKLLVSPTLGEGSFIAVSKGRGITDGKVVLNDSPIGPQAVSDGLGPAVFGGIRGYVPTRISADVITDQAGFESASQTVNILPGARTGYLASVGEEATAIIVASIRNPDGSPAALLAGTIAPLDGSRPPVETFTNRSGRLVAETLVAGDYRLVIPGAGTAIFTLAEDQVGIVQLGELTLRAQD